MNSRPACILIAAIAFLVLAEICAGEAWGPAGCGPVGPSAYAATPAVYRWEPTSDPRQLALFRGGVQLGVYWPEDGSYHALQAGKWGPRIELPAEAPPLPAGRKRLDVTPVDRKGHVNYGINLDQLAQEAQPGGRATLTGKEIPIDDAIQAIENGVPDDRHKLRLTLIGSAADRQRVLEDLEKSPLLSDWRDKLLVQSYSPEHWAVSRVGFKTDGQPTLYVQAPTGQVLHRQDDYAGGAEAFAGALRKINPDYKADRDPDRRKSSWWPSWLSAMKWPDWSMSEILVAGALLGAAWFLVPRVPRS